MRADFENNGGKERKEKYELTQQDTERHTNIDSARTEQKAE